MTPYYLNKKRPFSKTHIETVKSQWQRKILKAARGKNDNVQKNPTRL